MEAVRHCYLLYLSRRAAFVFFAAIFLGVSRALFEAISLPCPTGIRFAVGVDPPPLTFPPIPFALVSKLQFDSIRIGFGPSVKVAVRQAQLFHQLSPMILRRVKLQDKFPVLFLSLVVGIQGRLVFPAKVTQRTTRMLVRDRLMTLFA